MDGLAKASILDIDGVAVPPAIAAPAAAFSVRLLDTAVGVPTYTGAAMRVRRDTAGGTGDDDEGDIAFDSGVISLDSAISNASAGVTATTLGQFLNVGTVNGTTYTNPDSLTVTASCWVDTWMDQSGNSNDAEQATYGNQPQIHDGTVDTDLVTENGNPAVQFNASPNYMPFPATQNPSFYYSIFIVRQGTTGIFLGSLDTNEYWIDIGIGGTATSLQNGFNGVGAASDYDIFRKNGATAFTTTTTRTEYAAAFNDGNQVLMSALTDGTAATRNFTSLNLGSYTGGGLAYNGVAQEFIMYQSTTGNQSSNVSAIETDINGFFGIY